MTGWEVMLILLGWGLGAGSPGPATLTISGTAMARGRAAGVTAGAGVLVGSAAWGLASAMGMGAVMMTNAWVFTALKYAGGAYLLWLAYKSARRALAMRDLPEPGALRGGLGRIFAKGLAIHLTNPKAILGWGAIYALVLPASAPAGAVFVLYGQLLSVSALVFLGYGVLFSSPALVRTYRRARRWFEGGFAVLFGAASLKILTTRAV